MIGEEDYSSNGEDRPLQHLTSSVRNDVAAVRTTATGLEQQIEAFVRERPLVAVFGALGLGFIVARLVSRR
ncbi:MAG TPA: hypothetical protein VGK20_08770 [Candidatus Binatia bacterium]